MRELDVFLGEVKIGRLWTEGDNRFNFIYEMISAGEERVPPLSLSLPYREEAFTDEEARPFFTNLLPEAAVIDAVAKKLGVSVRNEFELLARLGGECAGAVTLLPPGQKPEDVIEYKELPEDELNKIVEELPRRPFLAGEEKVRLSLAGAQEKLPLYVEGETIFLPQGTAPSSHIFKPNIRDYEGSVRNEAFCMALAHRMGLKVPYAYARQGKEELYVVERYDRTRDKNGKIQRLHQEDFCQAMGLSSENKYEKEGGPTLANCFELLAKRSTSPALDRKQLLQWVVFNYLIHNADAHGKNISLILSDEDIRLAPFYDLLCTKVYEGLQERLAMRIGREDRPQWVQSRHWEGFSESIDIGKKLVFSILKEMTYTIEGVARDTIELQNEQWGKSEILEEIFEVIGSQVRHTNFYV